jgi:GDP-L-fucose synthase
MKCLILGGTGFIGQEIIKQRPNWQWVSVGKTDVDLTVEAEIPKLYNDYDVIVNCAGYYGGLPFNQKYKSVIYPKNVEINKNVCKLVNDTKPTKFVNIGSACIYPATAKNILKEKDITGTNFHQSVEASASSKYHMLKLMQSIDIPWEYLILSNVYGPGEHLDMEKSHFVGALANKIFQATETVNMLGTGKALRDFLYTQDMAEAVCRYCELDKSTCSPTNVSTGNGYSIKQVLDILLKTSGKNLQVLWGQEKDNGTLYKVLDNSKMLLDIEFSPSQNLELGVEELWQWLTTKQ